MENPLTALRYFLITLGSCLIIAGSMLIGYVVYEILFKPEEVRIIQYIIGHFSTDGPTIFGTSSIGLPTESKYEFNLSESAKSIIFFFLGVMTLSVLGGLMKAIVTSGITIINAALSDWKTPQKEKASQLDQWGKSSSSRAGTSRLP